MLLAAPLAALLSGRGWAHSPASVPETVLRSVIKGPGEVYDPSPPALLFYALTVALLLTLLPPAAQGGHQAELRWWAQRRREGRADPRGPAGPRRARQPHHRRPRQAHQEDRGRPAQHQRHRVRRTRLLQDHRPRPAQRRRMARPSGRHHHQGRRSRHHLRTPRRPRPGLGDRPGGHPRPGNQQVVPRGVLHRRQGRRPDGELDGRGLFLERRQARRALDRPG